MDRENNNFACPNALICTAHILSLRKLYQQRMQKPISSQILKVYPFIRQHRKTPSFRKVIKLLKCIQFRMCRLGGAAKSG